MSKQKRKIISRALSLIALFAGIYAGTVAVWTYSVTPLAITEAKSRGLFQLDSFPTEAIDILLAVEDPSFYQHNGVDFFTPGQGKTTISQSAAKMIYLSDAHLTGIQGILQGMFKKVWETVPALDLGRDLMAVVLNSKVDKNTQLQIFLRNVYMGNYEGQEIYGFDVAAQMYYHKKVAEMSQDEIIALVAMIKAPNKYHPLDSKQFHTQRVRRIQRLLRKECKPNGVFDADLNGCAS